MDDGWREYRKTATVRAKLIDNVSELPTEDPNIEVASATKACISTPEGDVYPSFPFYLCRGDHGDIWPVRPDIFEATYEEVDDGG